jgi:hypothetical protein
MPWPALSARIGRLTHGGEPYAGLPRNSVYAVMRAAAVHGQTYDPPAAPLRDDPDRDHVAEVAYRICVLRQLARHVVAVQRGEPGYRSSAGAAMPIKTDARAWEAFAQYANPAPRPFHVRVWTSDADRYDVGEWPTVYEVAVLQLVNDLATQAVMQTCANVQSRRPFTRQRGRSRYQSSP